MLLLHLIHLIWQGILSLIAMFVFFAVIALIYTYAGIKVVFLVLGLFLIGCCFEMYRILTNPKLSKLEKFNQIMGKYK